MARITVVQDAEGDNPFTSLLVWDLDRVHREATIHPPGQVQNIKPVDKAALKAKLEDIAGGAVTDAEVDLFIAGTVGDGTGSAGTGDDIGDANLDTAAAGDIANIDATDVDGEEDALRSLLSVKFIETGNFLLSFNDGVLAKALELGWIKVFTDAGDELFSL